MPIIIPAPRTDMRDATLTVETETGDHYRMTLRDADGEIVADADGFRPANGTDFGNGDDWDTPTQDARSVSTFAAFLGAALEYPEHVGALAVQRG